jgi:hypothetical protein
VRYFVLRYKVTWLQLGYLPVHAQHDYNVLDMVWRGEL